MRRFLTSFALYSASIALALFFLHDLAPMIAKFNIRSLPPLRSEHEVDMFLYSYLGKAAFVLGSAGLAASVGFWMRGNPLLRRVTLTMPLWAMVAYTQIYLHMILK